MISKKKLPILCILFVLPIPLFIGGFFLSVLINPSPHEYYIFQTIDECEQLIPADQTGLTIDRYDTPEKDKKLKGLSYESFFGMKFHSDEVEYEIFAYEFPDTSSALKYYIQVTGQRSYEKELPLSEFDDNKRLLSSRGMSPYYDLIAVYQNKAYVITAPQRCIGALSELLAATFSFRLF